MRVARISVGFTVALLLAACGAGSFSNAPNPIATESLADTGEFALDDLLRDVEITKERKGLPDLTEDESRSILEMAREANPEGKIRSVFNGEHFHSSERVVRVAYEPHEVGERVRNYWTLEFEKTTVDVGGDRGERRSVWRPPGDKPKLVRSQEVCPPWRSFLGGLPPTETEIVDLWGTGYLLSSVKQAHVLPLVDAVRPLIPATHRLFMIFRLNDEDRDEAEARGRPWPLGAEVYEVFTAVGCGGVVIRVEHVDGHWTASEAGRWVS